MTKDTYKRDWIIFWCFVAGMAVVGCKLIQRSEPSTITPKLMRSVTNTAPDLVIKRSAVIIQPPPEIKMLVWNKYIDPRTVGYTIQGSDTSSMDLLGSTITVGLTNRIPDPGWLYVEVRTIGTDGTISEPAVGQRVLVTRDEGVSTITFVPRAWFTNLVESSDDLKTWTPVAKVYGFARTNVTDISNNPFRVYRARAL